LGIAISCKKSTLTEVAPITVAPKFNMEQTLSEGAQEIR
jgi:hypothetical protein